MAKILVIEDEELLRTEVAEWLFLEGYETATAADGVEGVEQATRVLPDLIVCDITMPRLDGYGVLLELRANPATMRIPFVFVTARAAYDDVRQGMELGADDYITKPFSRLELLHAVQTRLAKQETQEQAHQQELREWQQAVEDERERRLLKAKLVAMFSHDFRNPLAAILSSSSLLRKYSDRMDEARRLTHFDRIEASVKQLVQMLDDMLVVSRMESGALEVTPQAMNVGDFLQGIVAEFQMIHSGSCQILFENQLAGSFYVDHRLLRQIAANLISNAVKYSPQGSEVCVSLTPEGSTFVLAVEDHGIGIPEEDQRLLFDAFHRATNVGKVQGTGLGLAIVKQAVDAHGGTIDLQSQVGVGTTMSVRLPAQPA